MPHTDLGNHGSLSEQDILPFSCFRVYITGDVDIAWPFYATISTNSGLTLREKGTLCGKASSKRKTHPVYNGDVNRQRVVTFELECHSSDPSTSSISSASGGTSTNTSRLMQPRQRGQRGFASDVLMTSSIHFRQNT